MKRLANQIQRELQVGEWKHCAVYEGELKRFWPLNEEDREANIAEFANKYGFRLRLYRKGLCAIFDRRPRTTCRSVLIKSRPGVEEGPSKMPVPHGECENRMAALGLRSYSKTIDISAGLRNQSLKAWQPSVRLTGVLRRAGVRVLGDLHGRKVDDFAREKNCGSKTLHELDSLARRAQSGAEKASTPESAPLPQNGTGFAIPESISQLQFHELPITARLANIVRSIGARTLGDLKGCSPFELLQYKTCGLRTLSEIQQLIERAISGEFDEAQIEDSTAASELLTLLEQGMAKLSPRENQFLLARIGGDDLPCLTFSEIGRRYGFTRARVHQAVAKALDTLRKSWGPRVPRLLEMMKRRCLSMGCPLTPALLEQWIGKSSSSFRLSRKAQVRLMEALDKNILSWLEKH